MALRQPEHQATVERFDLHLGSGINPYDSENFAISAKMATHPDYCVGSHGVPASLDGLVWIYRFGSFAAFYNLSNWHNGSGSIANFKRAVDDFDGNEWLKLAAYAKGPLRHIRNLLWWTDFDLSAIQVMKAIHRIGITNTYLVPESVIIRCAVAPEIASGATVPTVVDAYQSLIFHPTKTSNRPRAGETIDVGDVGNLASGVGEFTLPSAPVHLVEFFPVRISAELMRDSPVEDRDISAALELFYLRLCG